jgi:hypothetical protein
LPESGNCSPRDAPHEVRLAPTAASCRSARFRARDETAARLTYAFSKRVENLAAAVALHVAFYNYCRIHQTLRCTPAMAAFVTDRLWSMDDLFDAVMEHAERKRKDARLAKLLAKLKDR